MSNWELGISILSKHDTPSKLVLATGVAFRGNTVGTFVSILQSSTSWQLLYLNFVLTFKIIDDFTTTQLENKYQKKIECTYWSWFLPFLIEFFFGFRQEFLNYKRKQIHIIRYFKIET